MHKKMFLISKEEFERFNQYQQNKDSRELSRIKQDKNLSKHEKNIKFKNKLDTFLSGSKKLREPMKIKVQEEKEEKIPEKNEEDLTVQKLKTFLPSDMRRKGHAIYTKLRNLENVKEGKDYVIINNRKFNNNLFDYVAEALRNDTVDSPLKGYYRVAQLMKIAKIRGTSLKNNFYKAALRRVYENINNSNISDVSQSGSGINTKKWKIFRY